MTYTYTIYFNEFNAAFVKYLIRKFENTYISDTRATLVVTEEEADKIASMMYKNEATCSAAYDDFYTIDQEVEKVFEAVKDAHREMLNAFCSFIDSPANKAACAMSKENLDKYLAIRELVCDMTQILFMK